MQIIKELLNDNFKILIIVIVLDIIFGILRAIKEKSVNSTIGINGMIRKAGMLITVVFLVIIDTIVDINLIGFLPEVVRTSLNLQSVGINVLFSILFTVFEVLSIFKNMILCGLPIPKKWNDTIQDFFKEWTGELSTTQQITTNKIEIINKGDDKK